MERAARRSGNEWEAEVDPWAVVVRHGRWYLLCHSHRADAIRSYRVDRVRAVQQTAHEFEPPRGLDPGGRVEDELMGISFTRLDGLSWKKPELGPVPWIFGGG